mmetsp:Transcript_9887/g.21492  ORF Transcript_9887/g.21492 Transcript_9887/m.21492 type:complete len:103 (+) Transcript_9887:920-1228(+)
MNDASLDNLGPEPNQLSLRDNFNATGGNKTKSCKLTKGVLEPVSTGTKDDPACDAHPRGTTRMIGSRQRTAKGATRNTKNRFNRTDSADWGNLERATTTPLS